jgi:hypothetical protein
MTRCFSFWFIWVFYNNGCYSQVTSWRSAKSQVEIHFQVPNIYAKDNGTCSKTSQYFIHETSFNMWLDSWSSILQANSVPLQHVQRCSSKNYRYSLPPRSQMSGRFHGWRHETSPMCWRRPKSFPNKDS